MVPEFRRPIQINFRSSSFSFKDILTPDQNNLLCLYRSKTTSQEMRCGFRCVLSLDILNKIKFNYVRTIKINWKGQLKEVPKMVGKYHEYITQALWNSNKKKKGIHPKNRVLLQKEKNYLANIFRASFRTKIWPKKWMDHSQSKWYSWDYWHPTLDNLTKTHKTTPTLV